MNARQRSIYELEREVDFSLALGDGRRFPESMPIFKGVIWLQPFEPFPSEIPPRPDENSTQHSPA